MVTAMTFTGKQFQTAAWRRRGKPLEFSVQNWQYMEPPVDWVATDNEPEWPGGREAEVILKVDPLLDILRMGAAFGTFAGVLQGLKPDTTSEGMSDLSDKLSLIDREVPKIRAALRECLVPPSRLKWDEVVESVDVIMLGQLVNWLLSEMSPMDPTRRASSSDGSVPTSDTSTDGAPAEA
jgi:hypothetical protein